MVFKDLGKFGKTEVAFSRPEMSGKTTTTTTKIQTISVLPFFLAPYRTKCLGNQILIGHSILMTLKQSDTRRAKEQWL